MIKIFPFLSLIDMRVASENPKEFVRTPSILPLPNTSCTYLIECHGPWRV